MLDYRKQFFPDAEFSDFVLRVHHPPIAVPGALFTDYKLHRVILCRQSQWFRQAFKGVFKNTSDVTEIREENSIYFNAMIQHMYEGSYALREAHNGDEKIRTIVTHIGIHKLAQKYQNDSLQAFSVQALAEFMAKLASSTKASNLSSAQQELERLDERIAIVTACERFYETVTAATTDTPVGRVIASAAWACDGLVMSQQFDKMLKERPTLAVDVLLGIKATKPSPEELNRRCEASILADLGRDSRPRKIRRGELGGL
ncbi:uncharacterized protein BDZ99DRAFT_531062 [Mytilinidion resinicola]|uniref:BTB domain-containing protein n=1 Tax=Mytilinidion resinicola TaxID=574789 RepID=A0A6A6Z9W5_9PEZI|nr:uncharacterized protein BDZ99DRAFT_531062 [Mytilinidion resinicola]KAF2817806.1 hypothetical protein BDZ99DRAFT_531062 [Mytilinidion resinicola]